MARYTGPVCKLCRREGEKLFLKGDRCLSEKCSVDRRRYAPGQHGQASKKKSAYGLQLREKQKAKRIYGVFERQFSFYFEKASKLKGIVGENLLVLLERRLDNVVYRLGFAPSRNSARQLVRHRHVLVNSHIVDIPSYQVSPRDVIKVKDDSRELDLIHTSLRKMGKTRELPWFSLDKASLTGVILELPKRDDIKIPVEEQLIVELYSK